MNAPSDSPVSSCWVLTDGSVGMEIQCLGLAEALGCAPQVKRIQVTKPWRWLPSGLIPNPLGTIGPKRDQVSPPWPELLISCGRQSVAVAAAIRRANGGKTFAVHIQDPKVDPARFDTLIVPSHDRLRGGNVLVATGALNRITDARLAEAADAYETRLLHIPRPRITVLIGGNNKVYRLTRGIARRLGQGLAELAKREGAGLLITPSRRTAADRVDILREALAGCASVIWNGAGENPYFAYLALADALVVTGDSVNMVSEAATTGKPVYVVDLLGGSAKFRRFHDGMRRAGITRRFEGRLEHWSYPALRDTEKIAAEIRARLNTWQEGRGHPERPAA